MYSWKKRETTKKTVKFQDFNLNANTHTYIYISIYIHTYIYVSIRQYFKGTGCTLSGWLNSKKSTEMKLGNTHDGLICLVIFCM